MIYSFFAMIYRGRNRMPGFQIHAIVLVLLLGPLNTLAQNRSDSLLISFSLDNASFPEFVSQLEPLSGCRFYYLDEWVSDLYISCSVENANLAEILVRALEGSGLEFYIDRELNVILTPLIKLTADLPVTYSPEAATVDIRDAKALITESEGRYINGRKTARAETIIIGSAESSSAGRKVIINGKMSDLESGEPLIGATIYVEELKKGSISDMKGQYSLVIGRGTYSILINCMGMKEQRYFLQVNSDGVLDLALEKELISINEVSVKADRYHNVSGIQMGFERLDIKSIKQIPVVMGEKDLLKIAQMLPGVQSVGEGSSGFNVRGSSADQNLFYINKIPVYNPSHLFGFFSSFNPDIVKDFRLFKSNIPAEYGGRLASYFDISTRDGNRNKLSMRGGISPIMGRLTVEGPIKKDYASFMIGARSTYSDWILKRLENPDLRNSNAGFYDLAGNVTVEPNRNNLIKVLAYYSSDRFTLATSNDFRYSNSGGSVEWRHRFSSALTADFSAVAGQYAYQTVDNTYPSTAYRHDYSIGHYEARGDARWILGLNHSLKFGANLIHYRLDRGDVLPEGPESQRIPIKLGNESGIESAFYIADEFRVFPWLTIYGGLRYSLYSYLGPSTVFEYYPLSPVQPDNVSDTLSFGAGPVKTYAGAEPRFALNFQTGTNSSVKLSYNRMRQYIFMLSNTIAIAPADQWKLADYHLRPPYLDQYSIGFYKDFPEQGIATSLEAYYKKTRDALEYKDGANFISSPSVETEILQGDQQAYGIELLLKRNAGKLSGWIAYNWSRSEVQVNGPLPWEKINLGKPFPANYDRPHSLDLVSTLKYSRRISISSNLVYSTGRPVTYPVSIYLYDGKEIVDYSQRNQYRLPDYFRIDLSLNIEGNLKARKIAHSYWMFSIYNLTGRKNAYSVYFLSEDGKINGYKLSIFGTQIFSVSWNFKFGNYASE